MRDLESRDELTSRQIFVIAVSAFAQLIDFLDFFLISFVIAMVAAPWRLTFNQSTVILLSSGIGAVIGSFVCGAAADRWGRRPVFLTTIVIFGLGTVALAFTPEGSWTYVAAARFFVGFATTGIYSANIPLLQEFMPAKRRGLLSGVVATFIPVGMLIGAALVALLGASIGWRGLFIIGAVPVLPLLFAATFVPESPVWLAENGQDQASRRSIAWALKLPLDKIASTPARRLGNRAKPSLLELLKYPRSLVVSWVGFLGAQTGIYGLSLWAPVLLVLLVGVAPTRAAYLMIFVSLGDIAGRVFFAWASERVGRRRIGICQGFLGAALMVTAALTAHASIGGVSVFWLLLIAIYFVVSGSFAVTAPYAAEIWPAHLRASGLGSAYGVGSLGKIIGPLGLGLFLGSSNVISPAASLDAILPGLAYLAMWLLATGIVFLTLAMETKGKTIDEIASELTKSRSLVAPALGLAKHER
jgi:MFS transporter, putative metabolite:H+ symporter